MAKKKITPGFIYPSEAEALTQAMATIGQQGQRMATGREGNEERVCIPVSITARDSGTGYYSWTEQTYDATGVRITRPGGLTGTHTFNPLRLLGDTVLTTFPVEGLIVRAIGTATKGVVYEAVAVASSTEIEYVSKVCITRSYGTIQDITVEHKTARIYGEILTDETVCTDGDDDCCPVTPCNGLGCDDGITWPRQITVTISGTGQNIDGVYTLTWSDVVDFPTLTGPGYSLSTVCDTWYGGAPLYFAVQCVFGAINFSVYLDDTEFNDLGVVPDCAPLYATGTITDPDPLPSNDCWDGTTLTWAITE